MRPIILGPCPCSECGVLLWWRGLRWEERVDVRYGSHVCLARPLTRNDRRILRRRATA